MAKQRTSLKEAKGGHKHRDLDDLLNKVGEKPAQVATQETRVQLPVRVGKSQRDALKKKVIDYNISIQSLLETVILQFNHGEKELSLWIEQHVPKND